MTFKVLITAFLVILHLIENVAGNGSYGICTKYAKGALKPDLENGEYYCMSDQEFEYCKSYTCPESGCQMPLAPKEGKCKYCPGTCSYGGSVYKVGMGFVIPCLDGSNMCNCFDDNSVASTRMGTSIERMCRVK